jgi:hypothetical protein
MSHARHGFSLIGNPCELVPLEMSQIMQPHAGQASRIARRPKSIAHNTIRNMTAVVGFDVNESF